MPPLFLIIDQGGHASRAFVFDALGNERSRGTSPIEAKTTTNGGIEYNADLLLQSIQAAIQQAVASPDIRLTDIVAAGMATQRSNAACWDQLSGEPLSSIISWQDRRAARWMEQFQPHATQVHQTTGLFLSPHYGVGKLQWCIKNIPDVRGAYEQQRLCWGPMSSFLLRRLLDEKPYLVDHVNASRTLLWNLGRQEWDQNLIDLFELPDNPLPNCVPNRYPFGTLTIAGHAIPMTLVMGDQSASLFAWQQLQQDALYLNIGTGAFIQRVTGSDCIIAPKLLTSLLLQQETGARYALEGTVNGAGSALGWIAQQWQLAPDKLYQQLPQWLQQNNIDMLFLNGISGIGSPYWQAEFDSRFIGATNAEQNIEQQVVAVIESIAFLIQRNIKQLQYHRPGATKILISGGLTQLDGLCQRIADLSGLVIHRMAGCEATASGVAWLLAQQQSKSTGANIKWNRREQQQIQPQNNPLLAERYRRWQLTMEHAIDDTGTNDS